MFNLKWVFRNLIADKRRSGGIIGFIAAILIIMTVNLLFIDGVNTQMKAALRNNKGDLYFWSDQNLTQAFRYLERYHVKN